MSDIAICVACLAWSIEFCHFGAIFCIFFRLIFNNPNFLIWGRLGRFYCYRSFFRCWYELFLFEVFLRKLILILLTILCTKYIHFLSWAKWDGTDVPFMVVVVIWFYEWTFDVFFNFIKIHIIKGLIWFTLAYSAKIWTRLHDVWFLNLTLVFNRSIEDHFAAVSRFMLVKLFEVFSAVTTFCSAMGARGLVVRGLGVRNSISIIRFCMPCLVIRSCVIKHCISIIPLLLLGTVMTLFLLINFYFISLISWISLGLVPFFLLFRITESIIRRSCLMFWLWS